MGSPPSLILSRKGFLTLALTRRDTKAPGDFIIVVAISRLRTFPSVPRTYLNSFMRETKYRSLRLRTLERSLAGTVCSSQASQSSTPSSKTARGENMRCPRV